MKIIPAIDLMEGKVVRLYKGDPEKKTIYSENPIDIAKKWEKAGADMIHLGDLDAALGRGSNMDIIKKENLKKILGKYGKKRIVISVDHIDGNIMIEGWQKSTGKNLIEGIKDFIEMGFSEFLLTNVNKDGTLQGPDLEFLHKACKINNINVISSGGISNIDDVIKVKQNNAYGVILGKALYENLVSIEEAKKIS